MSKPSYNKNDDDYTHSIIVGLRVSLKFIRYLWPSFFRKIYIVLESFGLRSSNDGCLNWRGGCAV